MDIPTWREVEEKFGYPVRYSEYIRYLRENYNEQLQQNDFSEE